MLTLTREPAENLSAVLKIEGEATVEQAAQLHQALLEGLKEFDHLQVDCEKTSAIDFFAIQLLCSAHRTAIDWNKRLTFSGTPSAAVAEEVRMVGVARQSGCSLCPADTHCLWL